MATQNTALRNALCDANAAIFNGGSVKVFKGGSTLVLTFTLSATAFGAAGAGVASAASMPKLDTADVATAGGDTLTAMLESADGLKTWSGLTVTATGGGGAITLNNVVFAAGTSVSLTALTLTEPA